MEDIKYYTPKIEDLFEGYEFEHQEYDEFVDVYTDNWVKSGFDSRGGLGHDLTHDFNDGRVRVPYLSKEQIEAEGWKYLGGFWWEWPIKDSIYVEEFSNRTLDFRLNFSSPDKYLIMEAYERNSFDWERVFAGPCPTVNELRTLQRWFKIK